MQKEVESQNPEYQDEFDSLDYFMVDCPITLPLLDKIVNDIAMEGIFNDCSTKEEAVAKLKDIHNSPNKYYGKYKWHNISIAELFKMDYNNLIKNNLINLELIPSEKFFNERFFYKYIPEMIYPFSVKEYFPKILFIKLEGTIDKYFNTLNYKKNKENKKN